MPTSRLEQLIADAEGSLMTDWMDSLAKSIPSSRGVISEGEQRVNAHDFVLALRQALATGSEQETSTSAWAPVREMLSNLSRQRASQGFTPTETATFVFSFKEALFKEMRKVYVRDPVVMAEETWNATKLLDKLGLYTAEVYLKSREDLITGQQQEMLELSTPVVELWPGIVALPLIGTLDSARTGIVMQNLLEAVVNKEADFAIIDITGVPMVDTLVAQHLLKTVAAAKLMGTECIISGIRPQIAQTIIHLGVDLGDVITKASLADAFRIALKKKNLVVTKA